MYNFDVIMLSETYFHAEPKPSQIASSDGVKSTNISWKSPSVLDDQSINKTYVLTIVTTSNHPWSKSITLQQPYYVFTPEDAPPCEVYNFSVTATYVGATYTGAGCSVPSEVHSTSLLSLPDIRGLQSSLRHSLKKQLNKTVSLNVSFLVR